MIKGVSGKSVLVGAGIVCLGTLAAYWLMNNVDAVDDIVG